MKYKLELQISEVFFLAVIFFCSSCSSKINRDFLYFQRGLDSIGAVQAKETVIKTNDILNIKVGSRSLNQEQTRLFNIGNGDSAIYTINAAGNIDLPMIGSVKAAGLTIVQLQTILAEKLVSYVKDPLVRVKYAQFVINVLGEVKSPGTKNFPTDNVTIIDALSISGDLTDDAKREDIMVIREENGRRKYFKVDLKSGAVFQSPVYQLQPHDLLYIPANKNKLIRINQNPASGKVLSTSLTVVSLITTVVSLILFANR
jgi:polysaccharide export outer membrane protein